jgi:hypothetical protein
MEEAKKQNDKNNRNDVDLTYQDVHDLLQRLGRYTSKLDGLSFRGILPFDFLSFFPRVWFSGGIRKEERRKKKRSSRKQRQSGTYGKLGND